MKKLLLTAGITVLAAVLATSTFAASRGASFTPLGLFDESFPLTTAVDISGDGKTIVGMHAFFSGNYVWTAETGLNSLGPVSGAPWIATDGSEITSTPFEPVNFDFSQSALWAGGFYPDQTWDFIPTADGFAFCDSSGQSSYNINDDGSIVVGLTWIDEDGNGNGCEGASAFIWEDGVGTSVLSNAVNDDSTRANAVNADGSVVIGWMQTNTREASKWVNGVQAFLCPDPIGAGGENFCTEGWDVTPDGSLMLTSMATPADFNARATLVDQAGNYEQLPFPQAPGDPMWDTFSGWQISDDGNTVVGEFGGGGFFGSPPYPVLWNRDLGVTIDLQVMLLGQGLDDLFFWFLSDASAVNSDGTVIAGSGINPDGWIEAYVVDISKVKVCHKPEGNGQGNDRTIAIGWESVPDHLAHGDFLATCEFASSGAASRAYAARRSANSVNTADVTHDARVGSIDEINQIRAKLGDSGFQGRANSYPTDDDPSRQLSNADYTDEQRRQSLDRRLQRSRGRR